MQHSDKIDPSTRIIFLDIDGVLNHQQYFRDNMGEHYHIDPECVKELNHIVQRTGAKIVISSTWRELFSVEELQERLKNKGFTGEIIGETPRIEAKHYMIPRGCEIYNWIQEHVDQAIIEYRRYVIIDDDSDMLLWQAEHYIRTSFDGGGLTRSAAYRTIRTLLGLENIPEF